MNIGITYDLRDEYLLKGYTKEETAEFDKRDTIEAIDESIRSLGHTTDLIGHIHNLTTRLAAGERWDLVFNIAEGLRGFGREAQVPALLDAFDIPYTFSDPLVLSLTLHKGMTKHVIRDLGIPTPDFTVVESELDIPGIDLSFPLFAKPVAEGTGKGIGASSRITDRQGLRTACLHLLRMFNQPVLVEEFLPGREFTVGIVGTGKEAHAIGVMEVLLKGSAEPGAYSYWNKENYEHHVEYRLVSDATARKAVEVALASWRGLGCRDAGRIDLRSDAVGVPNFIEVNPLAGLNPIHSDLCIIASKKGISYRSLIEAILSSAFARYGHCVSGSAAGAGGE